MKEHKKLEIENNLNHPEKGKLIDLSQESLSVSDYKWLAEMIEKSSFVEEIRLPKISKNDAEIILSILEQATIKQSTLVMLDFNLAEFKEDIPENIALKLKQIQSRLKRNTKQIMGVQAAGPIGLGLIGDIVSKSNKDQSKHRSPYHLLGTSRDQFKTHLINKTNKVYLQHDESSTVETTLIENVTIISNEETESLYTQACLVALCVTPAILTEMAKNIAKALIARYKIDGSGLKILVLMNTPNSSNFAKDLISKEIESLAGEELAAKIIHGLEFIQTVIDRIVTPIPATEVLKQLKSQLINPDETTRRFFDNSIEDILNSPEKLTELAQIVATLNLKSPLFNAEEKFSMYVPNDFPEALRFPYMKVSNNLSLLEIVKNKFLNGPHVILAWLAGLFGYETLDEAIQNPMIATFVKELMEKEIGPILCAIYPELLKEELATFLTNFIERCKKIKDPHGRPSRNAIAKLTQDGRTVGTLNMKYEYRLEIETPRLEMGIGAGWVYGLKQLNPTDPGCQKIVEIYLKNGCSFDALLCYNGPIPGGNFVGFDHNKDKVKIDGIKDQIAVLNEWITGWEKQKTPSIPRITFTTSDCYPFLKWPFNDDELKYLQLLQAATVAIQPVKPKLKSITYNESSCVMWKSDKNTENKKQNEPTYNNSVVVKKIQR